MNRNIARPKHLRPLKVYEIVPEVSECNLAASGPCFGPVVNGSDRFDKLVSLYDPRIKFGASGFHDNRVKLMSKRCARLLRILANRVWINWKQKIFVMKSWTESDDITTPYGLHLEGRAVIIRKFSKNPYPTLGVIAGIAVRVGFDYVSYVSRSYVYLSVKPDGSAGAIYGGCFAANNLVTLPSNATMEISRLQVGDKVRAFDRWSGNIIDSRFVGFLDSTFAPLITVTTATGDVIQLTSSHLIHVVKGDSWNDVIIVHASNLRVGDYIMMDSNQKLKRTRVDDVTHDVGHVMAPLTEDGTIIVNKIAASCYAFTTSEIVAHYSMFPVRWFECCHGNHANVTGVHWYARLLCNFKNLFFPFFLE